MASEDTDTPWGSGHLENRWVMANLTLADGEPVRELLDEILHMIDAELDQMSSSKRRNAPAGVEAASRAGMTANSTGQSARRP